MSNDLDRIREALQFVPVGGHDERVRVAFMLKSELGEAGRDLWDEWRGERGDDEAASVWKSASETGPLKIGTLFHEAKAAGWRDEEIVEILAHVALNLFTNYVNVAFAVPVDFAGVKLRRSA